MKKIILLLNSILFSSIISAQTATFQWAKQFPVNGQDVSISIINDATGNIYTYGIFYDAIDFDPGPAVFNLTPVNASNSFLCKLNSSGNFVWAKQFGGEFTGYISNSNIYIDALDNIYITGSFSGTVDFDPGIGVANLTASGSYYDAFLLKLNSNGNFIWVKKFGGFINDSGIALDINDFGSLCFTGMFQGQIDLDPGSGISNVTAQGVYDCFIVKLDTAGNFIWGKAIGGLDDEIPKSVLQDLNGNVIISGYFNGSPDFDPGINTYTLSSLAGYETFICKLDAAGNFVWAKNFEGTSGDNFLGSCVLDATGNIYVTGSYENTVDFDPGVGTYFLSSGGVSAFYMVKLDVAGNLVWANGFKGGIGNPFENKGKSLFIDSYNDLYVGGTFSQTCDFDPGPSTYNITSASAYVIVFK